MYRTDGKLKPGFIFISFNSCCARTCPPDYIVAHLGGSGNLAKIDPEAINGFRICSFTEYQEAGKPLATAAINCIAVNAILSIESNADGLISRKLIFNAIRSRIKIECHKMISDRMVVNQKVKFWGISNLSSVKQVIETTLAELGLDDIKIEVLNSPYTETSLVLHFPHSHYCK